MTNLELKKIVKEVLSINLVDWLTKSQIQLIELELEVAGIDSEESVTEFIFSKSVKLDDAVDGKHGSLDIDICVSKLKFLVDKHISTNDISYKDNI